MKLKPLFIAGIVGCQLTSTAPNPQWLADFDKADSLLIQKHARKHVTSDPETIKRLQDIYENARWKPYRATLPAGLDARTINLQDRGTILRRFSYHGVLWETSSHTQCRTAEISGSDAAWIESLFTVVSDADSPAKLLKAR